MKKNKKILLVLLILIIGLLAFALTACDKNFSSDSSLNYLLNSEDNTYSVVSIKNTKKENIVVPASHNGRVVKSIINLRSENLVSVELPNTIVDIRGHAFKNNTKMTSINIPDSVCKIGADAFENSGVIDTEYGIDYVGKWVVKINYDNKVYANLPLRDDTIGIADYSCQDKRCSSAIIFPKSIKYIGDFAFNNSQLRLVWLPKGVEYGKNAFYSVDGIYSPYRYMKFLTEDAYNEKESGVYRTSTVLRYDNWQSDEFIVHDGLIYSIYGNEANCLLMTDECNERTEISINDIFDYCGKIYKTTKIEKYAFYYAENLQSVILPKYLEVIEDFAFAYCNLNIVKIPYGTKEIGKRAFYENGDIYGGLSEFWIPNSVVKVDQWAVQMNAQGKIYAEHVSKPVAFDESWAFCRNMYGMFDFKPQWGSIMDY